MRPLFSCLMPRSDSTAGNTPAFSFVSNGYDTTSKTRRREGLPIFPDHTTMKRSQKSYAISGAVRRAAGITPVLALLGLAAPSFAAPPGTMAPPVDTGLSGSAVGAPADAGQDTVFQWSEVPQNQRVPLTRAVFDQNGYQLYDTVGETIVVPFVGNNLYVMQFAESTDGTTYLINTGAAPVLYIPRGGFLENAAVPGARWYPFSDDFHPARPVYLGVAPSWDAFVSIGWAPDVIVRGGYWGRRDFVAGGVFLPSVGLTFEVGGRSFSGWQPYHDYVVVHPDHFRYGGAYADRGHSFRGVGSGYARGGEGSGDRDVHAGYGARRARVFQGARGDYRHDRR